MRARKAWVRRAMLAAGCAAIAIAAAAIVHIRRDVVPPGCRDAATLAALHRVLVHGFGLPESVRLERIETRAGGPLAFRFLCAADLGGLRGARLPPGPVPGSVRYSTRLSRTGHRLVLRASLAPLLQWMPVR